MINNLKKRDMKKEKQVMLNEIIKNYDIDIELGKVYDKKGKELPFQILPNGYHQRRLYNGRRNRNGKNVSVQGAYYLHQVIYFAKFGFYDEGCVIDHIDRDKSNNRIDNLRCVTHKVNVSNKGERSKSLSVKFVRGNEIAEIRRMMNLNMSQSAIARVLGLNRLTVRWTMKKIENGIPLKYDGVETMVEKYGKLKRG